MDVKISMDTENCNSLMMALSPDNDETIEIRCREKKIDINIKNLKMQSLYNIIDDILRDYETWLKMNEIN
ncbi:hypothetical protein [Picrophilus oshimae]|uniref:Uncharacterized protein n=1 Tax=Picrophilus torridus (strain ATCC 700027 / DSM 9790 / JCM 10055 / NBRC 100828 / KAW 2/3) TaxID=1122961 RepID=A0A8G2L840_PICTO|nr:hypothetical protein [Picrophilus oshimae]SMD31005.1 hypothetical protein SAMN02745355_0923 [Picrophilus oshimae DSM 9789]